MLEMSNSVFGVWFKDWENSFQQGAMVLQMVQGSKAAVYANAALRRELVSY